ncbi:cupin domain-containing protein [Streptomyces sp. NPDC056149]|uniref:cupin domain-containing protein n=1 Tax=Streptomyces sp. NPDC056149 TaxID=3345728 RepID=UPI0035DF11EA
MSFREAIRQAQVPTEVRRVLYVPAGGGKATWLSGDVYSVKVGAGDSGGSIAVIEASVPPGGGPPAHRHTDEDESFYVLAGEVHIRVGEDQHTARTGDFVFVPRDTPHQFHNASLHAAKLLLIFTPGGVENFFLEAGTEPTPGVPVPVEDPPGVAEVGARYGVIPASFD